MTLMGMYYPFNKMLIATMRYLLLLTHIHTGVGFGVARSTERAMSEPQSVGRVTGRLPRFFFVYQLKKWLLDSGSNPK